MKANLLGEVARGIERGVGHTHAGVNAALATGATLVVQERRIAESLRRGNPGAKVIALADVRLDKKHGPLIFDAACIQDLARETCEGPIKP